MSGMCGKSLTMRLILAGVTQTDVEGDGWGFWLRKNILEQVGLSGEDIGYLGQDVPCNLPILIFPSAGAKQKKGSPNILKSLLGITGIANYHGHIVKMSSGQLCGVTYHPETVRKKPNFLPVVIREISNLLFASQYPHKLNRPKVNIV